MNVGLLEILLTICFGRTVQAALVWNTGGTVGVSIFPPVNLLSFKISSFLAFYSYCHTTGSALKACVHVILFRGHVHAAQNLA